MFLDSNQYYALAMPIIMLLTEITDCCVLGQCILLEANYVQNMTNRI